VETLLNIALVAGLPRVVYVVFLRPRSLTWEASDEDVTMPLIGDELAPSSSATRAISIAAPMADVWKWVT
jgi:hypothetical protein